jgi:CheY-like chemotaxis protein
MVGKMMNYVVNNLLRVVTLVGVLVIGIPWVLVMMIPMAAIPLIFCAGVMAHLVISAFTGKRQAPYELKVLVVDDDESSVLSLLSILTNKSAEVFIVESGAMMIKELSKNKYDVVFVDRMMPQQNGDVALAMADTLVSNAKMVPVVFFTGMDRSFKTPLLSHFEVLGRWSKQMPYKKLEGEVEHLLQNINEEVA